MSDSMAYCGLDCAECPTYKATQANDDQMREKTAQDWSEQFQMNLIPKDINCDGCNSDTGRLFRHCLNCQIRECASKKGIPTCATCEQYPCDALSAFLAFVPQARQNLETLKNTKKA